MHIGLGLPQLGVFADPAATRRVAFAADLAGYSSLWAIDRLLVPTQPRTPYPASADGSLPTEQRTVLDPLVALTLAAAVTDRLGTNVLVAPWRTRSSPTRNSDRIGPCSSARCRRSVTTSNAPETSASTS